MKKDIRQIRELVEDIHRLMEALVTLQRDNHRCCRAVDLPIGQMTAGQSQETDDPEPEILRNRKEAASFLLVVPRTVTRYRVDGKLRFVYNDKNQIRYRKEDLRECYHWKWGKFP